MSDVRILPAGCICGHDHLTDRGEPIELCLECGCMGREDRCQNCGRPADLYTLKQRYDEPNACSQRCATQLAYAMQLLGAKP